MSHPGLGYVPDGDAFVRDANAGPTAGSCGRIAGEEPTRISHEHQVQHILIHGESTPELRDDALQQVVVV
ncbi:MAG TPA: hypothetical protein VGJ54_14360 [Streptosporangiaceae bacterium]